VRGLATIAALVVLAMATSAGTAGAFATPVHADRAGAKATVTPPTNLVDGQFVNVSWTGFVPSLPVYVFECVRTPKTISTQCIQPAGDLPHFTASPTGTGTVRYGVAEKQFAHFQCDDTHLCSLAVLESPTDLTSGVIVPITFQRPPGACPDAKSGPVSGEGATPAAYTLYKWENDVCNMSSHLNVTYTNDNSYDGMTHFAESNPNANFAVTGVPMPAPQASALAKTHHKFAYAPLSLTAVSIAFNIVDQQGHQVTHLVLTPQILAEIATGGLSTFDCPAGVSDSDCINLYGGDPEIRQLNPGISFPDGPIQFAIRAEHSASNLAFTTWLSKTEPSIWTYKTTTTWPPADPNPCHTCPPGVVGEGTAALGVGNPPSYTPADIYLGVIDSTYAAINDVPVASIQNPGQPAAGVAPTTASLAAALKDGKKNSDGTITPNYATGDPKAYPLPMLTYAVVPTSSGWPNFTSDDGKTLQAFLDYAAAKGQSDVPAGSFPLPKAQVAQTKTVAAEIPGGSTSPQGGGHHHHGNPGGSGGSPNGGSGAGAYTGGSGSGASTGSSGTGSGSGSGSGSTQGTSSHHHPSAKLKPVHKKKVAYTLTATQLSTPSSSPVVKALAALALFGLVFGPAVLLFSRGRSALSGRSIRNILPGGSGGGAA
jgi:phosphate transport system substrate-binding protein